MISFIILHYGNIADTIECIKSIKKQKTHKKISIIVVDNNSATNPQINLIKKYTTDIIKLDQNLGYAKGNNIGCKYAINKYHPDFLVVANNDIVIKQQDLVEKIYEIYLQDKFYALGPKIETNNGNSVNPFPAYKTEKDVKKALNKARKLVIIYNNVLLRKILNAYIKLKRIILKPKKLENGKQKEKDIPLHGCFIIFSKLYYQKYNEIFYGETFLYHEEEFLEYRRKKDHLLFLYDPSISVYHKEEASLNYSYSKEEYKKLIFKEKEIIKSLQLLLDAMRHNYNI